jgi:hypothetical protein
MTWEHSTEDYLLGRGIVYFSPLGSTNYLGERDLGNVSSFFLSLQSTRTEYFSSQGGTAANDKEVYVDVEPFLSFTVDDMNKENFALFSLGTLSTVSQLAGSAFNESVVAYKGTRFALAKRDIITSSVVVKNNAGTVAYTKGSDYDIYTSAKDRETGRIFVLSDSLITNGQTLKISYNYNAVTYSKIEATKNSSLEGFLRFVSDNVAGPSQELEIWRVILKPEEDVSFIGTSWSTLSFQGEILDDSDNHATSPYFNVIFT